MDSEASAISQRVLFELLIYVRLAEFGNFSVLLKVLVSKVIFSYVGELFIF